MKIEVFNEEMNSKLRGVRLDGEKVKEFMKEIISRVSICHISGSSSALDDDTKLLLIMLQIVWNEKEELVEEIERLNGLIESKDKIIERFSMAYPMRNKSDYNG